MKKKVMFCLLILLICSGCASTRSQNETIGENTDSLLKKTETMFTLAIGTNVEDPVIIIENLGNDYYDGLKVPAGDYYVEVIKEGYVSKRRKVSVKDMGVTITMNLEKRVSTGNNFALTVKANPFDARIRIMNIKPKYHDGILLAAGRYLIEVSKQGFIEQEKWIKINGKDYILSIDLLEKKGTQKSVKNNPAKNPRRLLVKCRPEVADIKILNSTEKYRDNMHLKQGKYLVEVSMNGYETSQKWAVLGDKDCILNVILKKE